MFQSVITALGIVAGAGVGFVARRLMKPGIDITKAEVLEKFNKALESSRPKEIASRVMAKIIAHGLEKRFDMVTLEAVANGKVPVAVHPAV